MGFFDRFKQENQSVTVTTAFKMITDESNGYYSWNGNMYQSDIVRAAIRPKVRAFGKTVAKHIRRNEKELKVNPEVYMRFLLEEPNPYMTGQMLQEKMMIQLELNNNAFAVIMRDDNGYPSEIYPVTSSSVEAVTNGRGELFLRFQMKNGKQVTFRYTDIIHLRKDYNDNDIFGDSPAQAITSLMEIVSTTDQGIVKAIKNSTVVKWLLKYHQTLRPEDLKKATKEFSDSFLNVETSDTGGAAAVDAKMDATQVQQGEVPINESLNKATVNRVYAFFSTNEKIVHSSYTENEWISFYEAVVEPDVIQASNEFTRKLFSRRERGFGNQIIFESSNLSFASMQTKLQLLGAVDRGALTPNEWRELMHYSPIEGGDQALRRLDTAPVSAITSEDTT